MEKLRKSWCNIPIILLKKTWYQQFPPCPTNFFNATRFPSIAYRIDFLSTLTVMKSIVFLAFFINIKYLLLLTAQYIVLLLTGDLLLGN